MDAVTKHDLRKEINAILEDADLSQISAHKVRQILEKKFKVELTTFRDKIDEMIMECVKSICRNDDSDDEPDSDKIDNERKDEVKSDEDKKQKPAKRTHPTKKSTKKKNDSSDESGSSSDDDEPLKKTSKKTVNKDSDSESDGGKTKKNKKAAAAPKKEPVRGKGKGFTRAYKLSPELAKIMGSDSMARHEVVKKTWQIIKERNLYDPNNKQYAICDEELLTVMSVKRFRTFGMLKYLRNHFLD